MGVGVWWAGEEGGGCRSVARGQGRGCGGERDSDSHCAL